MERVQGTAPRGRKGESWHNAEDNGRRAILHVGILHNVASFFACFEVSRFVLLNSDGEGLTCAGIRRLLRREPPIETMAENRCSTGCMGM